MKRILVTCGTGGVGKTTLSAALAIRAALQGKRTVVITIDPAKRLATSLGIDRLSDEPSDLTKTLNTACQKLDIRPHPQGSLHAIVPDTRNTFENFVRSMAATPKVAERVIRNPIFQIFAREFSGTNEYMALERLYTLSKNPDYDCIILDTPPSQNTLAFLEAPRLLARLFEEKFIRWLALPTNRLMAAGMRKGLGLLEKLTGQGFMTDLMEFATALVEVQARFTANLREVDALLRSKEVGFFLVTSPSLGIGPEAHAFLEQLRQKRMHFEGVILNRALSEIPSGKPVEDGPVAQLIETLRKREAISLAEILKRPETPIVVRLPELARDVHSVEDLLHVAQALSPVFSAARSSRS